MRGQYQRAKKRGIMIESQLGTLGNRRRLGIALTTRQCCCSTISARYNAAILAIVLDNASVRRPEHFAIETRQGKSLNAL